MKYLIIDWFNLVKRYTYSQDISDLDEAELISSLTINLINKITELISEFKPDMLYICSDNGYNRRATAINSDYKSDRKKFKSLTEEEKEKSYIEYLKKVIYTLPFPFIEVKNTEADLIVHILIRYLKRLDDKAKFIITTSDSDFIQLLNDDVIIFDWYKGEISVNNWYVKYKLDAWFNHRNYAIAKSIVGDKSDNIKGIYNWGWKKVSRLFNIIDKIFDNKIIISNVVELDRYINNILDNYNDKLNSKDKKLLENFKVILSDNNNKKLIQTNQSIIDMSNLENPFIYKINSAITRETFERKLKYNQQEFYKLLHLNIHKGNDTEYAQILQRNAKSSAILMHFSYKINQTVKNIKQAKVML